MRRRRLRTFIITLTYVFLAALFFEVYIRDPISDVRRALGILGGDDKTRIPGSLVQGMVQSNTDCRAIFENRKYQNGPPSDAFERDPYRAVRDLQTLVTDCSSLRRLHEYSSLPDSEADSEFPIAFGIKLHKNPDQAEQLLRTIYKPQNLYCIHVDKSSDETHGIFKNISRCFDNVHVIEDRIHVRYATFDHVTAELMLMRLCRKSKVKWKYYINLTGQEFPLKTNSEIVSILKVLNGTNDIESYPFPRSLLFKRVFSVKNLTTHPLPNDTLIFKGSAYGLFSRKFLDFILTNDIAQKVIFFFDNTTSPEESVWSTLNRLPGTPGGASVDARHDLQQQLAKAVVWKWDAQKCHGLYARSVCIFASGDLPWLRTRPELFANKFNVYLDKIAVDCMEEEIRNRTKFPLRNYLDFNFYRHLPHVAEKLKKLASKIS